MTSKAVRSDTGIGLSPAPPTSPEVSEDLRRSSKKVETAAVQRFRELLQEGQNYDGDVTEYWRKLVKFENEVSGLDADVNAAYLEVIEQNVRKEVPAKQTAAASSSGDYHISSHGFINFGNTCFANSALQFLFHIPGIDDIINQRADTSNPERAAFHHNLKALRSEYLKKRPNGERVEFLLRTLWDSPLLSQLELKWRQGDASELLALLYEILHVEHPNFKVSTSSMVVDPKTGATHVIGSVRENVSLAVSGKSPTLQGCVDQYLQTEKLEEPLRTYPNCTGKRMFFQGKPPLTIQFSLKRYTAGNQKIQIPVKGFDRPVRVPFCDAQGAVTSTAAYEVDSAICQSGTANEGHYFTLVRTKDGWKELNDRKERELSYEAGLAIIERDGYLVNARKI
jgi:Ubiquitin carboxyl-terminal hydrolase